MLAIEVNAVAARVAEHAVKNDPDAPLVRCCNERAKILDIPKHRINLMIVPGIVVVIALGLKYRVEVDAGDS